MISVASLAARAQSPAPADSSSTPAAQPAAAPAQTGSSSSSSSQTPAPSTPPAATPAPVPAAAPTWSVGPIDFSGEVSGYYAYNSNHPHNQNFNSSDGGNNLYNFNTQANSFDLAFAKLAMSHSPDPVGFELDFGFGRTISTINAAEPTTEGFQYVEQAYIEWKPAKAKGFEIDFGKFSTSAGAEVIEDYSNWNYSHSLLFAWAIPYYHFGLRTSWPIGKHFTGGFQLVNGWNNITDTINTGKTIGLTGALTYTKFTLNLNYYTGPMNQGTNKGFRNLFDTTLLLTPPGKINAYINFDYGNNANSFCSTCTAPSTANSASWYGVATAIHIQATPKWAFTPRVEWFDDAEGYELSGALPSPIWDIGGVAVAQQVKEATITVEYKLLEGLLWRLEWRRDWSTYPMFERGLAPIYADEGNYNTDPEGSGPLPFNDPAGLAGYSKSQNTVTIGLIAFFGPKR